MWHKIKLFFHNQWSSLSQKQRFGLFLAVLIVTIIPIITQAAVYDFVLEVASNLISILVNFLGKLLAVMLQCLIYVAQYNNFINEGVVREGWKVVRDVCNMFFVLGLLIVAFGTVLRLQNYSGKKAFTSLITGAIMVNFSKTICGLIIDFSQVIMLTFVNGFKDVGAGNLTQMLGLDSLFSITEGAELKSINIFTSYILALIYVVVALAAIIAMTVMLIQRAVLIWIHVVLSPFPYLLNAFPKSPLGSKGNVWWSNFTGLVIIGPILAFFLWLSFFTASGTKMNEPPTNKNSVNLSKQNGQDLNLKEGTTIDPNAAVTQSGTAQSIIKFLVSIGLLFGGMKIAKDSSSLVGGTIGSAMNQLNKLGKGTVKTLSKGGKTIAKNTGKLAGRTALKASGAIISGQSRNSGSTLGKTAQKIGTAATTWGNELTEARKKEKVDARLKTLKKIGLGVGDKTMESFQNVANDEGFKKVAHTAKVVKNVTIGAGVGALVGNPFAGAAAGAALVGGFESLLAPKNGEKIKNAVKGSKMSVYQKNYKDYDKDINDADVKLGNNQAAAKTKYENAKADAVKKYEENPDNKNDKDRKEDYVDDLKKAKDEYEFNKQEAKRDYRLDRQVAKDKLHKNLLDTEGNTNASEFINGNNDKGVKGTEKLKEDYETKRKAIMAGTYEFKNEKGETVNTSSLDNVAKTKMLKQTEEDYKKEIKEHYENYKPKKTVSRFAGYMNGADALNNFGDKLEKYHPMQLTMDAAGSYLKDITNAKTAVNDYSKNAKLTAKDFHGGTRRGITNFQEKFLGELSSSANPDSRAARDNIKDQISKLEDNKDDQKTIQSVMEGIANFEKKGNSVASFAEIIKELDGKSTGKKYNDVLSGIKLRQVGDSAIKGDGSKDLKVNSFANGKRQTNIIGVDFSKLNSIKDAVSTPEMTAGVNIAPEKIAEVSQELTGLIDQELANLNSTNSSLNTTPLADLEQRINQLRSDRAAAFQSGDQAAITSAQNSTAELEQLSRTRDLRQAKERLASPDNLANLSLKNTGISLNSAQESQTTIMHEALHGFGISNEELTESIAKAMAQGSYTIDDTAAVAQNITLAATQKGVSEDQLTSDDIAKAIAGIKPVSPAEQVIAKENGDTIINNITTINNNNSKIISENNTEDSAIDKNFINKSNENIIEEIKKSNNKNNERQNIEDSRYYMNKKNAKENTDKMNKFIKDFDSKQ